MVKRTTVSGLLGSLSSTGSIVRHIRSLPGPKKKLNESTWGRTRSLSLALGVVDPVDPVAEFIFFSLCLPILYFVFNIYVYIMCMCVYVM